ncbi:ergothioneine biosynthesis protein EgtC [Nocardia sp. NPDC058058]|uniref:ergothioneine biosynthesis protein EgtC n=1 Tax=Nocardia sp. NPDC058058 TaxID=3346317 RepID=UPI0036D98FFB
MCRHLAYLGPPASVGELLTRGPNSLRTQSWAPRDMRGGGTINADGFGVAWWTSAPPPHGAGVIWHGGTRQDLAALPGPGPDGGADAVAERSVPRADPAESLPDAVRAHSRAARPQATPGAPAATRYRNAAPIWTDPAVDEVLPQLRSPAVLAAVRSATVGLPVEQTACAPFTHGRWAFSHNGAIPDWRAALTAVAARFDSPSLLEAESLTDSAVLWVILRGLLDGGRLGPEAALRAVTQAVLERSPNARLNLLLGDGDSVWATTWRHALTVLPGDEFTVVASEAYDEDPRWRAIADGQLVVARPGWLSVEDLNIEIGRADS